MRPTLARTFVIATMWCNRARRFVFRGGKSTGNTSFAEGQLVFQGAVVNVPSLNAPGFIKSTSSDSTGGSYPDISSCQGVAITAMALTEFDGFRFSFGNAHPIDGKFFSYAHPERSIQMRRAPPPLG